MRFETLRLRDTFLLLKQKTLVTEVRAAGGRDNFCV